MKEIFVHGFLPLFASALVAWFAFARGYLTAAAAVAAACLGTVILVYAGIAAASSVAVCFFLTALMSRRRDRLQAQSGLRRRSRRDLGQVMANGLLLAVIAMVMAISAEFFWLLAFLGCLGAVAGDTWASDMAPFSAQQPRLITTWQAVPAGTPGAVTVFGCLLSALAGLLAAGVYLLVNVIVQLNVIMQEQPIPAFATTPAVLIAAGGGGLLGALADSVLGARFQASYRRADGALTDHPEEVDAAADSYQGGWRWLSNDLVNFANSLVGALAAVLIGAVCFGID